jgi:3',5'-cyclic AMP phosphodiesterase CpdA
VGGRQDGPSAAILHVSDPQFGRYHRFGEGVDSLASHLVRDLRGLAEEGVPPVDLIVLSGDIAEKGMKSEYDQARAFVDALCKHTGLGYERIVVVPGNHDVSWGLSAAYFAECEGNETPPREPYPKKWRHYQAFVASLHGEAAFTEDRPYRLHRFDDLRLVVAALNSTMKESHREGDHYGWCGVEQLRWFADELRTVRGMARVGVVHHNARRKATADNENLRDADDLDEILGPHLDLLLHGHTHQGREDRLADGTLVLATGSTAVTVDWRPGDVPNQYQIVELRPAALTRWGRQWSGTTWIADPRISRRGNHWQVDLPFEPPGWPRDPAPMSDMDLLRRRGELLLERRGEVGRRSGNDFVSRVEFVTRRDVGEGVIERRSKGHPPLDYLVVTRPAAPMRYVGILDGRLDESTVDRFDELVFGALRERGGTDLLLVHRGPEDPAVRAAARRRGVQVKTWTEYNDLLEPSAYADWLVGQLESDPVYPQQLYLEQRFRVIDRWGKESREVHDDLLSVIYDGVLDDESRFELVLGDAGFGKSFLVRRLAYQMLRNDQVCITPIVIYLRDRDKRQTIEEMVSNVLIPSRAAFNADRFRHSLEAGSLALLIDGYDEFAVRVGYTNAAAQLQTFVGALQGQAKVLLTTRPNHFRSADEVTSKLFESLRTVHHGRVYQLEPFDERQQSAFLTRWFELRDDRQAVATARRWMAALSRVDNLPELSKTPRMLSFMVEDLKLAEIEAASHAGTVTAADLYQRLVDHWLGTEAAKVDSDDERAVPPEERQRLLEDIALQLWQIGERDLTEQTLHKVARTLHLPRHELTLDQAAQLLGGRTLLQVDNRRWRFAHQSVWEFLLAKRLAAILRKGNDLAVLGEAELTGLTIRFLRDLAPAEAIEWGVGVVGGQP